jgi:hypothetical protein
MPINAGNALFSNADVYIGNYGATPPVFTTLVGLNTAPGVGWRHVGGTNGGVEWSEENSFSMAEMDQVKIAVGAAHTGTTVTVTMNLAEPTLLNLADALAGGTVDGTIDTNKVTKFTPNDATDFQVSYKALIIDGDAPAGLSGVNLRRRLYIPRALSTEGISLTYGKEDQVTFGVTFTAFYVDASTPYYTILEANPAP